MRNHGTPSERAMSRVMLSTDLTAAATGLGAAAAAAAPAAGLAVSRPDVRPPLAASAWAFAALCSALHRQAVRTRSWPPSPPMRVHTPTHLLTLEATADMKTDTAAITLLGAPRMLAELQRPASGLCRGDPTAAGQVGVRATQHPNDNPSSSSSSPEGTRTRLPERKGPPGVGLPVVRRRAWGVARRRVVFDEVHVEVRRDGLRVGALGRAELGGADAHPLGGVVDR